jgi:hypothetical protein
MMRSKKWVVSVGWLVDVDWVKALKDIMPTGNTETASGDWQGF